jgi:hypothetical protein
MKINEEDCIKIKPLHDKFHLGGSGYRAEAHIIAITDFINKEFKYLWLIEYDVYWEGNIKQIFKSCDNIECDFLTKGGDDRYFVRTTMNSPNWCWWGGLFGEISNIPIILRQGCFFPVNRFSNNMIDGIKEQLNRSTGFCEVYFPSLCVYYGLSYKTFPKNIFGEFCFQPQIDIHNNIEINKLYHPLKSYPISVN